jgi:drug/metabolite transporter (DMT)-like permease
MTVLLAFLAAFGFALGNVLQQKGDVETAARDRDPRFLVQILRPPVWLARLASQVAGWVFQAFALKNGALMVAQSVTTLSLVTALPLGAKITSQPVSGWVVVGAIAAVVGIMLFLFVGSPRAVPLSRTLSPGGRQCWRRSP